MPTLNPAFVKFLEGFPEAFGQLLNVADEWYKLQGEGPEVAEGIDESDEFEIGGRVELRTKSISHEEIDAITKGYAEGVVKEKAVEYIKGFVSGVMLAS